MGDWVGGAGVGLSAAGTDVEEGWGEEECGGTDCYFRKGVGADLMWMAWRLRIRYRSEREGVHQGPEIMRICLVSYRIFMFAFTFLLG